MNSFRNYSFVICLLIVLVSSISQAAVTKWVNAVTDFACDNTGQTDTAAQLQAAVNSAVNQRATLYLPSGTYLVGTTIALPGSLNGAQGTGFGIVGDGLRVTIIQTVGDSTGGLSIPYDADGISLQGFSVFGTGATCTATGLAVDGSRQPSGPAAGGSCDYMFVRNVEVFYFKVGMDLNDVSNSTFTSCDVAYCNTDGIYLHGSCNSISFIGSPSGSCGSSGCHISGGRGIEFRGCDAGGPLSPGTNPVDFLIDEGQGVTISNCNIEHYGSAPAIQLNGQVGVRVESSTMISFDGLAPYAIEQSILSSLSLDNVGAAGFSKAAAIRQDATIGCTLTAAQCYLLVDSYQNPSSTAPFDTYCAGPINTVIQSDGVAPGASLEGALRQRHYQGYGDDSLLYCSRTAGGFVWDDLDQYNEDLRAGLITRNIGDTGAPSFSQQINLSGGVTVTNAPLFSSVDFTLEQGAKLSLGGLTGSSPGQNLGGGLAFVGEPGLSPDWQIGNDNFALGDWGVYVRLLGTEVSIPRLYIDPEGRVTLGHTASAVQPVGTATLNVEGSVAIGSAGSVISNLRHGVVKLVRGAAVVADHNVTIQSRIILTAQSLGGVAIPQALAVASRKPGVSFTIRSAVAHDVSEVAWEMIEP